MRPHPNLRTQASHVDLCKLYALQEGRTGCESFVPILNNEATQRLARALRTRQTSYTSPEALFSDYKTYVLPSLTRFIGPELSALGKGQNVATSRGLFIWAVLFGEFELAAKIWEFCDTPLRLALLAKWIAQRMKGADPFRRQEANNMMIFYERLASDLLGCCPSARYAFEVLESTRKVASSMEVSLLHRGFELVRSKNVVATALHSAGYKLGFFGKYLNQYGTQPVGGVAHVPTPAHEPTEIERREAPVKHAIDDCLDSPRVNACALSDLDRAW